MCSENRQKQIAPKATFADRSEVLHLLWLLYPLAMPQGAASETVVLWQPMHSLEGGKEALCNHYHSAVQTGTLKPLLPALEFRCRVFGAEAAANSPSLESYSLHKQLCSGSHNLALETFMSPVSNDDQFNIFLTSFLRNKSQLQCGIGSKNCSPLIINAFKRCGVVINTKVRLRLRL